LSTFGTTTGKTGTYEIPGVSTGHYTVEFSPCGSQNLVTVFRHANVIAPRATTGVDATLVEGGSVSGLITTAGPGGVPVSGQCARVESASPDNAGSTGFSGPRGKYIASGLAPGRYTVYFGSPSCSLSLPPDLVPQWYKDEPTRAKATTITVTVGHTTTGIDAALQTTGEITGMIRGRSGAVLGGACVTAYPAGADSVPVGAVSQGGGYSLIDLQPGRYRVEFTSGCGATGYRTQWWRDASSKRTATVITVSADHVVSGVDASLSGR
jgi:hypothetical protein